MTRAKDEAEQIEDGELVEPPMRDSYWQECCDCGLVHRYRFSVKDGKVRFRIWRDNRATATARRRKRAVSR